MKITITYTDINGVKKDHVAFSLSAGLLTSIRYRLEALTQEKKVYMQVDLTKPKKFYYGFPLVSEDNAVMNSVYSNCIRKGMHEQGAMFEAKNFVMTFEELINFCFHTQLDFSQVQSINDIMIER